MRQTLLDDYLSARGHEAPLGSEKARGDFGRWIGEHLGLTRVDENGVAQAEVVDHQTVQSWMKGERMPVHSYEVFAEHYGSKMDILDPTQSSSPLGILLEAVDVLDVTEADRLVKRLPQAVDFVHDQAARSNLSRKLVAMQATRAASSKTLLERMWAVWLPERGLDILSEPAPWLKAAHQYSIAEPGWMPDSTWGTLYLIRGLAEEPRALKDRVDLLLMLAEYGCRIVSRGVDVPLELSMDFAAACVACIGVRLNGTHQEMLGQGTSLDSKFVDFLADSLFFMEGVDQFMIEARASGYFAGCEAHEWVEWLSQFVLRTRDHIEDELESAGLNHQDVVALLGTAVRMADDTEACLFHFDMGSDEDNEGPQYSGPAAPF